MAMMAAGHKLRVLLTAAIVDDIGAIIVVALFYTAVLQAAYLIATLAAVAALPFLNGWPI